MRGRRADEGQAVRLHHLGEAGVLRQEAVAGMDRVGAGDGGGRQDGRDVEVAVLGRRRADADALVGQAHMHRLGIGGGVHGDGRDAQLAAGALDAQRDLAAVGDQDLLEQGGRLRLSRIISTSPYSTGAPLATRMRADGAGLRRLDLVEGLHRLDQQQGLAGGDGLADGDERRRAGFGREIGDADHRAEAPRRDGWRVRRRRPGRLQRRPPGRRGAAAAGRRCCHGGGRRRARRGCGCPSRRSRSRSGRFRSASRRARGSRPGRTGCGHARLIRVGSDQVGHGGAAPARSPGCRRPQITPTAALET